MKQALISIVLATYNGELFLEEQLQSLLAQTYSHIEIIAVDDKSTDNTPKILEDYAKKYANIKVYVNPQNIGFIKNFQKGCSLASGEYIAPCDQDDYWDKKKLQKMYDAIGDAPMIYCDSFICDENLQKTGVKISDKVVCRQWNTCIELAIFCRIYGHAILMRRNILQNAYPFLDVIPHDWWFSYHSTLHGTIQFLPEALVYYRQHATNAFGMVDTKKRGDATKAQKRERKRTEKDDIRKRIFEFFNACPPAFTSEKELLKQLVDCYQNFSFQNNFKRCILFFKYHQTFLAPKKRSAIRNYLFCFKMFFMIK